MLRNITDWGGSVLAFIIVITVNALANSIPLGGQNTGQVSANYPSLFTPAGFTFSIWGLIYTGLTAYVIFQALPSQRHNATLAVISRPFMLNCLLNAGWIFAWHYDWLWLSLLLMIGILLTLIIIYRSLTSARLTLGWQQRCLVTVPFSVYCGWICVATLANISILQTAYGWNDVAISAVNWTLLKLTVAALVAGLVLWRQRDTAFVLVIAWAALGIAVKQQASPVVAGAATALALLVVGLVILNSLKKSGH